MNKGNWIGQVSALSTEHINTHTHNQTTVYKDINIKVIEKQRKYTNVITSFIRLAHINDNQILTQ